MEVPTLLGIRDRLANMAAADGHHDFDKGDRGVAKVFEQVFTGKGHKDIGTPTLPSGLLSEPEILNMFLGYFGDGQKTRAVELFREKFFRAEYTAELKRASDDPVPYQVSSTMISSRVSKTKNDVFTMTPSGFMNFLTGDSGRDVAFCIDAVSTSFYNIFKLPESGVAKRTAYFINPRESINDGAGKMDLTSEEGITESGEYSVQVKSIDDTYADQIVYKATDLSDSVPETFYSIFNIAMLPIGSYHGIPSLNVIYSKGDYSEPPDLILQNAKDGNTVRSLSKRISSFLRGASDDFRPYYTMIQRKRSGDWLQVLACLDRKRFGLDVPIILCTEDIICAAYAIAMGVDVLFTHVWRPGSNNTQNWLLYFRKNVAGDVITESARLERTIAALPRPDTALPYLLDSSYLTIRAAFLRFREEAMGRLLPEFEPAIAAVKAADKPQAIEAAIKTVMSLYARLVWSRASLPSIEAKGEEDLSSLAKVSRYETTLSILKRILKGKSGDVNTAVKAYVDNIVDRARGGPQLEVHINTMSIFGSFMSMRRSRESGIREHATGLFTFMYDYLTEEERSEFLQILTIPALRLTGASLDKYRVFLDTAQLFIGKVGNGPKVPNWVLVEAVVAETIDAPVETDLSGMSGGGGTQSMELSATYGPSVILALRYQNKQEREHRTSDLDGRRHSPITTCILFLNRLVSTMEEIRSDFDRNNEFMLKYLSQWLLAILNALPGASIKDEYKQVECFLLGMIFKHESDIKESTDLIEFLQNFSKGVYGIQMTEFKVRGCTVTNVPFTYDDTVSYSSLITDLKSLMRTTLSKMRHYEEDPMRETELREKEAARSAAARSQAELSMEVDAAESNADLAREDIVTLADKMENASRREEEASARADELRTKSVAERMKEASIRKNINGHVRKALHAAKKRGPKGMKTKTRNYRTLRKIRSQAFTNLTHKRIGLNQ
jgi:hypothetical protein